MGVLALIVVAVLIWLVLLYLKNANNLEDGESSPSYIPSTTFQGHRGGFVFTTRDGKTGYYRDIDV